MTIGKFMASAAAVGFLTASAPVQAAASFADVWAATQEGPYADLPQWQTRLSKFFSAGVDMLAASASRTLDDETDNLPPFQKLVHPIGICFAGTWTITESSPYTGYFANGSHGQIIVRASEAMGNPEPSSWRSFGFAGKIFPTADANDTTAYKTANFFTVDDLGGADAASFLDDPKSNKPATSFHLSTLAIFPTLTHIAKTFASADSNPGIRQVYEISELGLADPSTAVTPHLFQVVSETSERNGADDFRDELRLANYPNGLTFGIYVAEDDGQGWSRLGTIQLDREALSSGCDHRLHFHHPRTK